VTARELREECIYFRDGETASLIYPNGSHQQQEV
jgi:hypothetical protein